MDEAAFNRLSLQEKADFVQKQGRFIEGEDYYSYRILLYALDNHQLELVFDFTNQVVSVEFIEEQNRVYQLR